MPLFCPDPKGSHGQLIVVHLVTFETDYKDMFLMTYSKSKGGIDWMDCIGQHSIQDIISQG
jgi:hypothetical protein